SLHVVARAVDTFGNGRDATGDTTIDNGSPTLQWTAPADGALVRGTIDLRLDAGGAASVDIDVDGTAFAHLGAPPFATTLDTTPPADGPHTLAAHAHAAGGATTTRSIGIVVDNTAPSLAWTSPADGALVRGTIDLRLNAPDVTAVDVQVDGTPFAHLTGP